MRKKKQNIKWVQSITNGNFNESTKEHKVEELPGQYKGECVMKLQKNIKEVNHQTNYKGKCLVR